MWHIKKQMQLTNQQQFNTNASTTSPNKNYSNKETRISKQSRLKQHTIKFSTHILISVGTVVQADLRVRICMCMCVNSYQCNCRNECISCTKSIKNGKLPMFGGLDLAPPLQEAITATNSFIIASKNNMFNFLHQLH